MVPCRSPLTTFRIVMSLIDYYHSCSKEGIFKTTTLPMVLMNMIILMIQITKLPEEERERPHFFGNMKSCTAYWQKLSMSLGCFRSYHWTYQMPGQWGVYWQRLTN